MESRLRYLLYAGAATLAGGLYLGLDEPQDSNETTAGPALAATGVTLPKLTQVAGGDAAEMRRDLFKVVLPPPPEPPPVVLAAPVAPPPPPTPPLPDQLSALKVIGVVARGNSRAILVEVGDEAITVETGQPFGRDGTLSIGGIEANRVLVTDKTANVSKTFTLSEED